MCMYEYLYRVKVAWVAAQAGSQATRAIVHGGVERSAKNRSCGTGLWDVKG